MASASPSARARPRPVAWSRPRGSRRRSRSFSSSSPESGSSASTTGFTEPPAVRGRRVRAQSDMAASARSQPAPRLALFDLSLHSSSSSSSGALSLPGHREAITSPATSRRQLRNLRRRVQALEQEKRELALKLDALKHRKRRTRAQPEDSLTQREQDLAAKESLVERRLNQAERVKTELEEQLKAVQRSQSRGAAAALQFRVEQVVAREHALADREKQFRETREAFQIATGRERDQLRHTHSAALDATLHNDARERKLDEREARLAAREGALRSLKGLQVQIREEQFKVKLDRESLEQDRRTLASDRAAFSEDQGTVKDLQAELEALRRSFAAKEKQLSIATEMASTEKSVQEKLELLEAKRASLAKEEVRVETVRAELRHVKLLKTKLEKQTAERDRECAAAQAETREAARARRLALESQARAEAKQRDYERALKEIEARQAALADSQMVETRLTQQAHELASMEQRLAAKLDQLEARQRTLAASEKQLEGTRLALDQRMTDVGQAEHDVARRAAELEKKEAQLAAQVREDQERDAKERAKIERERDLLARELEKLREERAARDAEREALSNQRAELAAKAAETDAKHAQADSLRRAMEQKRAELEKECEVYYAEQSSLQDEASRTLQELQIERDKVAALRHHLEELKAEQVRMTKKLEDSSDASQREVGEYHRKLAVLEEERAKLREGQSTFAIDKARLDARAENVRAAETAVSQREKEIASSRASLAQEQERLDALRTSLGDSARQLEAQRSAVETRIQKLERDESELAARNEELDKLVTQAGASKAQIESELRHRELDVARKEEDVRAKEEAAEERRRRLDDGEKQLDDRQSRLERLLSEFTADKSSLEGLRSQLCEMQSKGRQDLDVKAQKLREDAERNRAIQTRARRELRDAAEELKVRANALELQQATLDARHQSLDERQRAIEERARELRALEVSLEREARERAAKRDELNAFQKSLEKRSTALAERSERAMEQELALAKRNAATQLREERLASRERLHRQQRDRDHRAAAVMTSRLESCSKRLEEKLQRKSRSSTADSAAPTMATRAAKASRESSFPGGAAGRDDAGLAKELLEEFRHVRKRQEQAWRTDLDELERAQRVMEHRLRDQAQELAERHRAEMDRLHGQVLALREREHTAATVPRRSSDSKPTRISGGPNSDLAFEAEKAKLREEIAKERQELQARQERELAQLEAERQELQSRVRKEWEKIQEERSSALERDEQLVGNISSQVRAHMSGDSVGGGAQSGAINSSLASSPEARSSPEGTAMIGQQPDIEQVVRSAVEELHREKVALQQELRERLLQQEQQRNAIEAERQQIAAQLEKHRQEVDSRLEHEQEILRQRWEELVAQRTFAAASQGEPESSNAPAGTMGLSESSGTTASSKSGGKAIPINHARPRGSREAPRQGASALRVDTAAVPTTQRDRTGQVRVAASEPREDTGPSTPRPPRAPQPSVGELQTLTPLLVARAREARRQIAEAIIMKERLDHDLEANAGGKGLEEDVEESELTKGLVRETTDLTPVKEGASAEETQSAEGDGSDAGSEESSSAHAKAAALDAAISGIREQRTRLALTGVTATPRAVNKSAKGGSKPAGAVAEKVHVQEKQLEDNEEGDSTAPSSERRSVAERTQQLESMHLQAQSVLQSANSGMQRLRRLASILEPLNADGLTRDIADEFYKLSRAVVEFLDNVKAAQSSASQASPLARALSRGLARLQQRQRALEDRFQDLVAQANQLVHLGQQRNELVNPKSPVMLARSSLMQEGFVASKSSFMSGIVGDDDPSTLHVQLQACLADLEESLKTRNELLHGQFRGGAVSPEPLAGPTGADEDSASSASGGTPSYLPRSPAEKAFDPETPSFAEEGAPRAGNDEEAIDLAAPGEPGALLADDDVGASSPWSASLTQESPGSEMQDAIESDDEEEASLRRALNLRLQQLSLEIALYDGEDDASDGDVDDDDGAGDNNDFKGDRGVEVSGDAAHEESRATGLQALHDDFRDVQAQLARLNQQPLNDS